MTLSFPFTSFCISLLFFSVPLCSTLNSDGLSLLALKAAIETDPTRVLDSWSESDSTPCHWSGIVCTRNRVTQLALPNKGFTGYIPSELGHLNSLKRLSLAHNNFSKPIPSRLFDATTLIVLDLSHNSFSGQVPDQIKNLKNLRHLDLSSNLLNESLPVSVVQLTDLVGTLNLSFNQFSGGVPASYGDLPVFLNLDLRHNNLTGKIPQVGSLLDQGPTAFYGNPGLCGFPLHALCPEAQNPRVFPKYPQNPNHSSPNVGDRPAKQKSSSGSVILSLISGVSVLVGVVSVSVWLLRRKGNSEEGKTGKENIQGFEGVVVDEERQKGKFMLIDEGFDFELEDLLRASAYVVGKSWSGIVYKVVVRRERGSGVAAPTIVAVRRLSEGDATWRLKEFESEVEGIGRIQHPNIVRLRAYYYAHDEKLLVTDFIRNGNLWAKLHEEDPSPSSSTPLSWATRLKIAQGIARGLTSIHDSTPRKFVHGNIKSTKILLDDDLQAYISGFGLDGLVSGTSKYSSIPSKKLTSSLTGRQISKSSVMYLAPEVRFSGAKYTQKSDVYSFGIVLLEILTGKGPDFGGPENDGRGLESFVRRAFREEHPLSEVIDPKLIHEISAKKQVLKTFHVALNCTEIDPEVRPRMRMVSESLDGIL